MKFESKQDYYVPTDFFIPTQTNPTEKIRSTKGDCVIRAFSIAAGLDWLEAFDILTDNARKTYNVPNDVTNYTQVFKAMGYECVTCKATSGKKRMTAEQFCKTHKSGRYILRLANHLCAVVDGKVRDTWNTANKCIYKYWVIND